MARAKSKHSAIQPRFIKGDVTRLYSLNLGGHFDLLFDLGCFHSLPEERRDDYVKGVTAEASPNATFMLFGFLSGGRRLTGPRGLDEGEIATRFGGAFDVLWERRSDAGNMGTAAWYRLRRHP
jgi:hypothetical protein